MFGFSKSESSEEEYSRTFVRQVFEVGRNTCRHVAEAVQMATMGDVSFPLNDDASAEVSLAILGTVLAVLKGHSTVMTRDRGVQIEGFCKRSLQKDYGLSPDEASNMIDVLEEYQRAFESAISLGKSPFGDISGIMICRCLGPQAMRLCVRGTSALNPFVHQVVGDLMSMRITQASTFWKGK